MSRQENRTKRLNRGDLRLSVVRADRQPLGEQVDVRVENQQIEHRDSFRVDSSKSILIRRLFAFPRGLYRVEVTRSPFRVESAFVNIRPAVETELEISFEDDSKVVPAPQPGEEPFPWSGFRRTRFFHELWQPPEGKEPVNPWRQGLQLKRKLRPPSAEDDDPGGSPPANSSRAELVGVRNAELSEANDPLPNISLGSVGRFLRIEGEVPTGSVVKVAVSPQEAAQVDPASLRLFRYEPRLERMLLVTRSGLSGNGSFVWGSVLKPGLYGVYGMPRDRARRMTIEMLRIVNQGRFFYEAGQIPMNRIIDSICKVILCVNPAFGFRILNDPIELDRIGFGDIIDNPYLYFGGDPIGIPTDPQGRSIGGPKDYLPVPGGPRPNPGPDGLPPGFRPPKDICEECTGIDVTIPPLGGGGFRPPEIDLASDCERWKSVGPSNLAGRFRSLAFHPDNGDIIYAGGAESGVWKSTDGGASWRPKMHNQLSLAIGALAVAPSDPQVVYAATGEYLTRRWTAASTFSGEGVYRSLDGGNDWDLMPTIESDRCSKVVVHPTDSDLVFVAGNWGIHRWNNASEQWVRISTLDTSDIALDPGNPERLYAAVENRQGIVRTDDASADSPTWTPMSEGLEVPGNIQNFGKIAVSPSNPGILYASLNTERLDRDGKWVHGKAQIYRWNGDHWTKTGEPLHNTQRYWCNALAIHPTNPDSIIAAGVDLSFSVDGGASWHRRHAGHADNHSIVFSPVDPDTSLIANDGGVWKSEGLSVDSDEGYSSANKGLVTIQFYNVSVAERGAFSIGGSTQDQGILKCGFTRVFEGLGGNEGGIFEVDPNDGNIIYWDPWSGNLRRTDNGSASGRRDATNGIQPLPDKDGNPTNVPSIDALAIHPADSDVLICSCPGPDGKRRIYRSEDGAAPEPSKGWKAVVDDTGGEVTRIAFAPSDPSQVYAITKGGRVWRSSDTGKSFSQVSDSSLPSGHLKGLVVDWHHPDTLFVCFAGTGLSFGHVWVSRDQGVKWRDISGARAFSRLPDLPFLAIAQREDHPETLFVATFLGVFRSNDGGDWWYPFDDGLPNAPVSDMCYRRRSHTLYVSTIGRGIWTREV